MKIELKADRFKDHHGYFMEMANAVGIGWGDSDEFMGKGLNYWAEKYKKDEHLNNHPLEAFDGYYPWHSSQCGPILGVWSMSYTVCCLKAVIKQKIFDNVEGSEKWH